MRHALLLLITAVIATAGCDDPTESDKGPSLRFVSGAGGSDTIFAASQDLVVEVRDESGNPASGVVVRFESNENRGMVIRGVADDYWGFVEGTTTDANGRATVRVGYGTRAAQTWIAASVPLYNLTDTARYTIRPGAAVAVRLSPADTLIAAGTTFTYPGAVVDGVGNFRPDAATFEVSGTAVTVTNAGTVSATGLGIATVRARALINGFSRVDSSKVIVVPHATIAWQDGSNLSLNSSTLTGENKKSLGGDASTPAWEPGGNRLVASSSAGLLILNESVYSRSLSTPGFTNAQWPEWSEGFIYFHGDVAGVRRVARIRPDGSGLQTITPDVVARMPSPSPDGTSIVYVAGDVDVQLTVLNLTTGATRILTPNAQGPRWSPDGQWIAYTRITDGSLMLIRPDGTGHRRIGAHGLYPGITWSPDSKWILGMEWRPTLVNIDTGVMEYLEVLWAMTGAPAWKR